MADWLKRRHHQQPREIEGHRNDQIGIGEKLGTRLGEPSREERQSLVPVPIFEALDKLAHRLEIARRGTRAV
jgi:hypothetical protein